MSPNSPNVPGSFWTRNGNGHWSVVNGPIFCSDPSDLKHLETVDHCIPCAVATSCYPRVSSATEFSSQLWKWSWNGLKLVISHSKRWMFISSQQVGLPEGIQPEATMRQERIPPLSRKWTKSERQTWDDAGRNGRVATRRNAGETVQEIGRSHFVGSSSLNNGNKDMDWDWSNFTQEWIVSMFIQNTGAIMYT